MVDFWTRLKNHLNDSIAIGAKKRSIIIQEMQRGMQRVDQSILPRRSIHGTAITTFDTYMNYLHKANYLFKPRRGWYGLADTIPSDLSIMDVKNMAYGEIRGSDYSIGWDLAEEVKDETVVLRVLKNRHTRKIKKDEFFKKEEFAI